MKLRTAVKAYWPYMLGGAVGFAVIALVVLAAWQIDPSTWDESKPDLLFVAKDGKIAVTSTGWLVLLAVGYLLWRLGRRKGDD